MEKEKQYLLLAADLLRALQSCSNLASFPSSMATLSSPSSLSISVATLASLLHLAGTSASDSFFSSPKEAQGAPSLTSHFQMAAVRIEPRLYFSSLLLQSVSKSTIDFYLSHTPSPSRGAIASSMSSLSTSSAAPAAIPAICHFISRLSDTLCRLTSDLKPWREMIDQSAISRSASLSKATLSPPRSPTGSLLLLSPGPDPTRYAISRTTGSLLLTSPTPPPLLLLPSDLRSDDQRPYEHHRLLSWLLLQAPLQPNPCLSVRPV